MSKNITRSYIYAFLKDFSFFSAVLIPFFTDWGHITLFQAQLLQSWFSLWIFILEVPTGALADKVGRKHSIALGSLIVAIAVIVYGSMPNFYIFLLAEFLFALGYSFTSGADQALVYDTLKSEGREDEAKKVMGRMDSLRLLGMGLAAPIGSFIASRYGLSAPTLLTAVPLFFAAAIGWSIQEPKLHSEGSQSPKYMEIVRKGLGQIKSKPLLRALAFDSVMVSGAAYFVIWFYQPLLQSLNFPLAYFGYLHLLMLGSEILVSSNYARLEKWLGSDHRYLRSSAIITTVSFMLVALYPHISTVILFLVLGGGIGITRATYLIGMASKHIDSRQRATVLSTIGMFKRLALVILNPVIGFIATRSLSTAIFIVGLLPLGALLMNKQEAREEEA
jgi:MFS family permease